ncbi:P2Y purinoceptor 14-like [Ostrea edulis]|uniref:P2Y purinoceptor 14-like n=1 Tax=Ostrea edulis TaxID=37623 RepID=UPI0020965CAA|nr:P2Y purinoceptor 14-like [Ostrea edulis]XP_048741749.1 P2Y purinoceptor 14-like [Ostrea edulis]
MQDEEKPSDIIVIVRCVVIVAAAVVCVIGNFMVLGTLFFVKYPKIPLFVVIGCLALSDIFRMVSEVPFYVIQWTNNGDLVTTGYCKVSVYVSEVSIFVAAFSLAIMSITRLLLLTDRGHSRKFVNRTYATCVILWLVTLLTNIPNIITSKKDELSQNCVEENSDIGVSEEVKLWLYVTFSFFFQLLLIFAIYLITFFLSKKYFTESYSRKERRLSMMVNILIVTFAIFKFPYIVVKLYEFYTSRKVKDLIDRFNNGEVSMDELQGHKDIVSFVKVDEVRRITECVSLLDLAIRPFIYYKLSYYFSNSFDKVINCNKYNRNSDIRIIARRRRNDTENTTCTTVTIDTARTPLHDDVSEGGSSDSINGCQFEGSITEYRFEGSVLNDELYDGSFCENLYDLTMEKRKFGGSFCDNDVRVHETDFLCQDARHVQSASVLYSNREEEARDCQRTSSTSQFQTDSTSVATDRVVFEI